MTRPTLQGSPLPALRVALRPSPAVAALLVIVHAGAVLGALALPLAPWSALLAGAAVLASAWQSLARHAFRRGPAAIAGIAHTESGGWRLVTAHGERIEGCTLAHAFVHPRLLVLSFRSPRGNIPVLVPGGASAADESRRLRVALRRLAVRSAAPQEEEPNLLHRARSCVLRGARRLASAWPARPGSGPP